MRTIKNTSNVDVITALENGTLPDLAAELSGTVSSQKRRTLLALAGLALVTLCLVIASARGETAMQRGVLNMPHGYVYADESEAWEASGRFTYPVCVQAVPDGFVTYPCNGSC